MLKKILAVVAVALVIFLVAVAMQPDDFRLSRSTLVNAAPAAVFPHVNDLHRWTWDPFSKLDPAMTTAFAGAAEGEGAVRSWAGKDNEGKMTIIKSQAPELVLINLEFTKPMAATNLAEFTFKPESTGTLVTWTMTGKNNFVAKAFHLVVDMEKMLGPDFERGLASLKAEVEAEKPLDQPAAASQPLDQPAPGGQPLDQPAAASQP